jgi:hypothetical protein
MGMRGKKGEVTRQEDRREGEMMMWEERDDEGERGWLIKEEPI